MYEKLFAKLTRYFFQGLLLIAPIAVTLLVLIWLFQTIDGWVHLKDYPGLGILIIIVSVTLLGSFATTFFAKPVLTVLESGINHIPIAKVIYGSIKDMVSAFVGDKRKFKKAVLATINRENGVKQLGFLTQESLDVLGLKDHVAVYFPHSYAISGYVYILPVENIQVLELPVSEVMKFVISGGVSFINPKAVEEDSVEHGL